MGMCRGLHYAHSRVDERGRSLQIVHRDVSPQNVLLGYAGEVKFVDLRFTDTRGKEQHVSVPISSFGDSKFTDGHYFDGSSIAGWNGIEASDMTLMPDPSTAVIDPFFAQTTLSIVCDVYEPVTGQPYNRCPRSIAKSAEKFLKSTGIGDTAFFGPEAEFFIFDSVRFDTGMNKAFYYI